MNKLDFEFAYCRGNENGVIKGKIEWSGEMKMDETKLLEIAEDQCINQLKTLYTEHMNKDGDVKWRSGRFTITAKITIEQFESLKPKTKKTTDKVKD